MKTRWVLLKKGERVRKGDKIHIWDPDTFEKVEDDIGSGSYDPFIVKDEWVIREVVIPTKHLRAAKL